MNTMNQKAYLDRINYRGDLGLTLEVLNGLQKSHLLSVPFENLDIHSHRTIELDIAKIYEKIVERNRGGFCYELNGLFFELLKSLGFTVKKVSARAYDQAKGFGPEYDHLAVIVRINDTDYLTDVGFGEFIFHPLKIEINEAQLDERGEFRLEKYDDSYLQVRQKVEDKWSPVYIFSLTEREFSEYQVMCSYHQTSAESHFTQKRMCSMPNEGGRVTLAGDRIKISDKSGVRNIIIKDEADFSKRIWEYFKVKL